ncbi:MAG: hypothetical protein ACRDHC_03735 [Actinomycetota bacterium]
MGGSTVSWFACPYCGKDLRQGALRCAHCDRSLLSASPPGVGADAQPPFLPPPAGPGTEPPWERRPDWAGQPPRAVSGDRRIAVTSCLIGGVTLAVPLMIRLIAMFSPSSVPYVAPLWLLAPGGIAGLIVHVAGLLLGLRARRLIAGSGDARGVTLATVGIWIGWVNIVLWVLGFVLPSLSLYLWLVDGVPP